MFYKSDWENDDHFVYLGSEQNPKTGLKYDYWLHDDQSDSKNLRYSPTARHGDSPEEYGSGPLCTGEYRDAKQYLYMMEAVNKDYIFGVERARHFALWYLATGRKLLLETD